MDTKRIESVSRVPAARLACLLLALGITACGSGSAVPPPDNDPPTPAGPVAEAGPDQSAVAGETVTLDGSSSRARGEAHLESQHWAQLSGPSVEIRNDTQLTAEFDVPTDAEAGTEFVFQLRVIDDQGNDDTDDTRVTITAVPNIAPEADAGANQTVTSGDTVTLDGSDSSDPDGEIVDWLWEQVDDSGVEAELAQDTADPQASFTAPEVEQETQLLLRLTVTDNDGAQDEDQMTVTVQPRDQAEPVGPTADAGSDQAAESGDSVTLDGSASQAGDAEIVDWLWEQTDGPAVEDLQQDRANPHASFTAPDVDEARDLVFRLTVTDENDATDTATTVVTVSPADEDTEDGLACAPDELPLIGGDCLELDPDDADFEALLAQAELEADATLRGCDPLDSSVCMYPFPSNHYTSEVAPHQIGGVDRGGTGRRIDFNVLGMPQNVAGRPIDPTEWNRSDGYSPGQLLMTFVPELGLIRDEDGAPTGPVRNAVPFNDLARFADPDTAVIVIDTETGERHPIWVETDLNAGFFFPPGGNEKPDETRRGLLVRPAMNFREGRRYVVVIRNLETDGGASIAAQPFFAGCRDDGAAAFLSPALNARCAQLEDEVFPAVEQHGIATEGNDSLYLAWDFTVASTENNVARLRHMRDTAFATLASDDGADCTRFEDGSACNTPDFEVGQVVEGSTRGKDYLEIHGTFSVPSFVTPVEPSPLEGAPLIEVLEALDDEALAELEAQCQDNAPDDAFCIAITEFRAGITDFDSELRLLASVSAPPNRLFYNPLDEFHPDDPAMQPFGDGLPDTVGEKTVPWICRLYEDARPDAPARPGVYGHGLFDQRRAITYDAVPDLSVFDPDNNYMFCAVDWFGFATGDIANVLAALPDMSQFQVVPDATQQGMLHFMFLARLLRDPDGLAAHPAFQDPDTGAPRFDNREVYYHGISQGGILGGPVVALSQDIERGVLDVPGMAYSLLLRRSTGWSRPAFADEVPFSFSTLAYTAYQDDLDRNLMFSLIQMLWDRGENNGYAHHIANNDALGGPDNTVMLRPAFADHLVTHWSAYNMGRTIAASGASVPFLADLYPRGCDTGVPHCFNNRDEFSAQRDPNVQLLFGLPLSDRDVAYDAPGGPRSMLSGLIQWDEGLTADPPIGNIPADWKDDEDPHGFPRNAPGSLCQQSHFLHPQGRLIDARGVIAGAVCPPLPTD